MAIFQKIIPVFVIFTFSLCGSEFPIQKSGDLLGILTSKGQAWIEVKEDEGFNYRYLSPWRGGSPTNGGGFDPKMLDQIDGLVVGNRVSLSWYWDGHLRVRKVKVIKPALKNGVFAGYLLEKGDNWFDARTESGKIPWRFYARWVGGMPEDGGGYDTEKFGFLDDANPNLPIRFSWSYDFRPRIDEFIDEGEDEDAFVPFYEGKTLSRPYLKNPSPSAPNFNPFDQSKPGGNPFDTVNPPVSNPFDEAKPGGNPFDSVEKPEQKPSPANPFDSAPPSEPTENPFDNVKLPGNPFDTLEKPNP
jgi:hypothetical protein